MGKKSGKEVPRCDNKECKGGELSAFGNAKEVTIFSASRRRALITPHYRCPACGRMQAGKTRVIEK